MQLNADGALTERVALAAMFGYSLAAIEQQAVVCGSLVRACGLLAQLAGCGYPQR